MKYNKIAVISDLHANLQMLNEFLYFVDQEKIELIINLGNFISGGLHSCEVVDILFKDKRFINIRGYGETKIFEDEKIKSKLGEVRLNKIKCLPSIKMLEFGDTRFLMMHLNGFIEISQEMAHTGNYMIEGGDYDYVFCGGSHLQQFTHMKEPFFNTNIIEPGSLSKDENDKGYFVVIEMEENNKSKITFQSIVCSKKKQKCIRHIESECFNIIPIGELVDVVEAIVTREETWVQIEQNKKQINEIFKEKVIKSIVEIAYQETKYISIGCWQDESKLAKEILYYLKCRRIRVCEKSKQHWYIGEITLDIKNYILKEIMMSKEILKWFELSFLEGLYDIEPVYSIFNSGRKCLIKRIAKDELFNIKEALKIYEVDCVIREK